QTGFRGRIAAHSFGSLSHAHLPAKKSCCRRSSPNRPRTHRYPSLSDSKPIVSLRRMRRVAVTGLGAVTPIGNDVRSTWEAAVAGRSGIDWIRSFDPGDSPVRVAAEVKDFEPADVASPKEVRKLERNVLLSLGAAREAMGDAGLNGFDPMRVGVVFGTAIGGINGILEQEEIRRERGADRVSPNFLPNVLVDSASGQLATSLGIRGP